MPVTRIWTAEDYTWIESLIALGLPLARVARLVRPPTSPRNLTEALDRGGITERGNFGSKGRPSPDRLAYWDGLEASVADGSEISEYVEAKLRRLAADMGYAIVGYIYRTDKDADEGDHHA